MTSLQAEMRAGSRGGRARERGRWSLPKWLFRGSVAGTGPEKLVQANVEIPRVLQAAQRPEPARRGEPGRRGAGRGTGSWTSRGRPVAAGAPGKELGFSPKSHWKPLGQSEKECVMI